MIDQLEGMEQEMPRRPDTVEDLDTLRERLEQEVAAHGNKSLEARRLLARVAALEMYHNPKPVAVPMNFESNLTEASGRHSAMGGDNTDIWIEEEDPASEDPDLFGDDNRPLVWARSYLRWGFSIGKLILRGGLPKVPVDGDWRLFQKEPPTLEQVGQWWGEDDQDGRICIFTGYSGLYVFDFDETELRRRWATSLMTKILNLDTENVYDQHIPRLGVVLTGSGGYHVYVRTENPLPGCHLLAKGVTGYGSGRHVVAPPSKHENGGRYQWATSYQKIPQVPTELYRLMLESARGLDD